MLDLRRGRLPRTKAVHLKAASNAELMLAGTPIWLRGQS